MEGNNKIIHELGKISGKLDTLDKSLTDSMKMMRDDMLRAHKEQSEAIMALRQEVRQMIESSEARTDAKIADLTKRVERLEEEDKRIVEKIAGVATIGGGVGSALVAGVIELVKRF